MKCPCPHQLALAAVFTKYSRSYLYQQHAADPQRYGLTDSGLYLQLHTTAFFQELCEAPLVLIPPHQTDSLDPHSLGGISNGSVSLSQFQKSSFKKVSRTAQHHNHLC